MMRIDVYLSQMGYAKSRQNAKNLIEGGKVTFDGRIASKPSEQIDDNIEHNIEVESEKYVCRGALKLEAAIDTFKIDVSDRICIDIGASTGGFTDVLLSKGAKNVYAVDSGHGQLDMSLANDPRVVNIEGYNGRNLSKKDFPGLFDIAVMDVSFISQTYILGGIADVLSDEGILVSLIKPQFEAGRKAVGKNGIVKKKDDRCAAIERVVLAGAEQGLFCKGLMRSPIEGGDGNIEYLAYFTKNQSDYKIDKAFVKGLLKTEGGR